MKLTKQHILDKALQLFNQHGFVNVRLQHIADAAFVSVGHLAYHFKNKDAIVSTLFTNLQKEQTLILNEYKTVPLFEDINQLLLANFVLQEKYIFFYLDTLEVIRAYPDIAIKYAQQVQWQQAQYLLMLQFNIARGSLITLNTNQTQNIIWLLQHSIDMYKYNCKLQNVAASPQHFLQVIWTLLAPYFTPMGSNEYQQLLYPNNAQA